MTLRNDIVSVEVTPIGFWLESDPPQGNVVLCYADGTSETRRMNEYQYLVARASTAGGISTEQFERLRDYTRRLGTERERQRMDNIAQAH